MGKRSRSAALFLAVFFIFLAPLPAHSAESIATLKEMTGDVTLMRNGADTSVSAGQTLMEGDILRTGEKAQATIEHKDGFTSKMGPSATLRISTKAFDISGLTLARGWLETNGKRLKDTSEFRVTDPVAAHGVRGTAFSVIGANNGASLVLVREGQVDVGIGRDVTLLSAGQEAEGSLSSGYASPGKAKTDSGQYESWRAEKERETKTRIQKVLEELQRLQKQEDADWQALNAEAIAAAGRAGGGNLSGDDRAFFRKVFDIMDRMNARRLLAVDLREWAGITSKKDAQDERMRLQKTWDTQDWQWKAGADASRGTASSAEAPENLKEYTKRMDEEMKNTNIEMPKTILARADTGSLFPDKVKGLYLGMTLEEFKKARPQAAAPAMEMPDDMPVVYQEKQLSGGDWSKEGWFTGMYTIYKGQLVQGAFLAFAGTDKLRKELLQKFVSAYGKPSRYRLEPDWAVPGTKKGSVIEWKKDGVEIVLISRIVPTLQGKTRGLELRIRLEGFNAVLDNAGQFSAAQGESDPQLAIDFPELGEMLKKAK